MYNPRRIFLNQISLIAGSAALSKPMASVAAISKTVNTLQNGNTGVTIYHTSDLRGNIEPVFKNSGGFSLIKTELQRQLTSGLLLDAGNFINGKQSPYRQKQVIALMNRMGYHAVAVGSHELLMGQDHLATLAPMMNFSLLNCNYEFSGNLKNVVKPYTIIKTGKFKVGITAVGSKVNGIKYTDAIASANKIAIALKKDKKCDMVVCLSHLGDQVEGNEPCNRELAAQSENIDLIIGSNNSKLTINSMVLHNKIKHEVILAQTGWDGLMVGRTAVSFDADKKKNGLEANHIIPGTKPKSFAAAFANLSLAKAPQV